jgi:hypothetical protein
MPWRNLLAQFGGLLLRLWRWVNRSFGGLLIAIILLVSAALLVLQIPSVKQAVVQRLVSQSLEATSVRASIGTVNGFFPIQITVDDVEAHLETVGSVSIHQIDLQLQPFPLLFGRTSISSLRVDSLTTQVDIPAWQSWQASQPASSPFSGSLSVPNLEVTNGTINLTGAEQSTGLQSSTGAQQSLSISDVAILGRIESNPSVQLISLESLQFVLPQQSESPFIASGQFTASGQWYRDEERAELNQLDVQHPHLQFTGELAMDAPRDASLSDIWQGFLSGDIPGMIRWNASTLETDLFPSVQSPWAEAFPSLTTQGSLEKDEGQWVIQDLQLYTQESSLSVSGRIPATWFDISPLTAPERMTTFPWQLTVESARLSKEELQSQPELDGLASVLGDVALATEITHQNGTFTWDVDLNEPNGTTTISSSGELQGSPDGLTLTSMEADVAFDGFTRELSSIMGQIPPIPGFIREGDDQFGVELTGQGTLRVDSTALWALQNSGVVWFPTPPTLATTYRASDSQIGRFQTDQLDVSVSWSPDSLSGHQLAYNIGLEGIGLKAQSEGTLSYPRWQPTNSPNSSDSPSVWTQTTTFSQWTGSVLKPRLFETSTDLAFTLSSTIASDWQAKGRADVDVTMRDGVFLGTPIVPFDASLSKSEDAIVLSSDAFEAAILGDIRGESIIDLAYLIGTSLGQQFAHLYQFEPFQGAQTIPTWAKTTSPQQFTFDLAMSNGAILAPWVGLERLESQGSITGTIKRDGLSLHLQATAQDPRIVLQNILVTGLESELDAQWRLDQPWTTSGIMDWSLQSTTLQSRLGSLTNPRWTASIDGQETSLSLRSESTNQGLKTTLLASAVRNPSTQGNPSTLEIQLDALEVGRSSYTWTLQAPSLWTYTQEDSWQFSPTTFTSGVQEFRLQGTYSNNAEDAFTLSFQNTDLGDALQFIESRLQWDATLNGSLTTRRLGTSPSLQGRLVGAGATLNDRYIGDLFVESRLDSASNRFVVEASLEDSLWEAFDIQIQGSLANPLNPRPDPNQLDLRADIQRLDVWILEEIIPNVVSQSQGYVQGAARAQQIQGQTEFTGSVEFQNTQLIPNFLNTQLSLDGTMRYDLLDGFTLDSLQLQDTRDGSAILDGTLGVTSLNPDATIPFNLRLDATSLHLLNNPFDPDIPFFSSITGSGRLDLTGTQDAPVISTPQAIELAQNSEISIPILDVTTVDNNTRFIRFVDKIPAFGEPLSGERAQSTAPGALIPIQGDSLIVSELSRLSPATTSFQDLFTLDLQFRAPNPVQAELIFDQVTNDQIRAQGTGDLRLTLEDGDVSVFGTMDIASGQYNFVSGDVLSRQFQLQEGGSISWDGDPYDAELDVSAVYRARPSLASLGSPAGTATESSLGQRIPIELVLDIFGPLTEVQNEFFFQLPSELGGFSDPTLSTRIQSLNQNDEQKLVQAFSLLLTGNFIASGQTTFEDASAFQGITGSAVLINPFVSQQLISPLLSNQINALFSENVTFDVDVNIDAYNEVELGVALRLYNDRLVLRREGQITGNQSSIGDLGAEYRINQLLSLSAFHRQDPTFVQATGSQGSGSSAGETQVMNGVGLQARTEFHTWRELFARVSRGFSTLKWWD